MTYRGIVKKGVVVLPKKAELKDGTAVRILPITAQRKKKPSKAIQPLQRVGRWSGGPEELERLLEQVQELRDADLVMEREKWQ